MTDTNVCPTSRGARLRGSGVQDVPGRFCASRSVWALVELSAVKLVQAQKSEDVQKARKLFREYEAWLGISLCFQNFENEVAGLPGDYQPPNGRLLLAIKDEKLAGCIALRKLSHDTCEMKRLYLRPEARGQGLGRRLVEEIIDQARDIGYQRMRLDTLPGRMDTAIRLYRSLGFREIPPYYDNPVLGATFMELDL